MERTPQGRKSLIKTPAPALYAADRPSGADLSRWLKDHEADKEIEIVLGGDLDLSSRYDDR